MTRSDRPDPHVGRNPIVTTYEQGPFPAAPCEPPPPELVDLVFRTTGRRISAEDLEVIERIRLFLDWQGIVLTPELQANQWLTRDPTEDLQARVRELTRPRRRVAGRAGRVVDPNDLGD
jgi:hypothetical protein